MFSFRGDPVLGQGRGLSVVGENLVFQTTSPLHASLLSCFSATAFEAGPAEGQDPQDPPYVNCLQKIIELTQQDILCLRF